MKQRAIVTSVLALAVALGLAGCGVITIEEAARMPVETHDSPFGPMAAHLTGTGFSVDYPAEWEVAAEKDQRCGRAEFCWGSPEGAILIIQEGEIGGPGLDGIALPEYLDLVIADFDRSTSGFEFNGREAFESAGGVQGQMLSYTSDGGAVVTRELWAVNEDNEAVTVSVMAWSDDFEAIEPVARYVFDSVRRTGG
jgi:hypothetical protein